MAADAATIGASMSQYTGNAALGGGGLGAFKLDLRPVEDFAKYVMLYNKAEYDQRQKDAEKAAEELADFTKLDLSTTIPKHAKILQDKYDELFKWVQANPDALKYNMKDSKGRVIQNAKWLEYKKKKADLENDIKFAKMNSVLNESRKKQIADEPNENIRSYLQTKLDSEIESKNIRDILDFQPKYDLTLPDWGQNKGQSLDVLVRNPNDNIQKQSIVFDVTEGKRLANAYAIGLAGIDQTNESGKLKAFTLQDNSLIKAAGIFNSAVANAMQNIDQTKSPADQEAELKKNLSGLGIMTSVNQYNDYMADMRAAIREKRFDDETGKRLNADDYTDINFKDGISPEEVSLLAQFAGWEGDKTALKQTQTNNQNERDRIAAEWARIAQGNRQLDLAEKKMNEEKADVVSDVSSVLNSATQMLLTGEKRVANNPDGSKNDLVVISDPDLMRQFGTIESDGSIKDAPDAIQYDKQANKIYLRYYNTNKKATKGLKQGERIFDDLKNKAMEPTEFLTSLIKKKFPNKDIGQIGSLVNRWYEASNNNLFKMAENYNIYSQSKLSGTPDTKVVTTPGSNKSSTSRWDKYKIKQ